MPRGIVTIVILAVLATAAVAAGQVFFGLGGEVASTAEGTPAADALTSTR